jgi:CheY-like chemotaxis protein
MATILVVDDELFARSVFKRVILRAFPDVRVLEAGDGLAARQMLDNNTVDLMILDMNMPRMDGMGLLVELRQSDKFKELPIIVVSSMTSEEIRQRVIGFDVVDALSKLDVNTSSEETNPLIQHLHKMLDIHHESPLILAANG